MSQIRFEWREILLRDKPAEFLKISSDGTVPVLQNGDEVIQESLDIFLWALEGHEFLENYDAHIVSQNDGAFKTALDRYKYSSRHGEEEGAQARETGSDFIRYLDLILAKKPYLKGDILGATDLAILPFIRQFAHVDQDWFYAQDWHNVIKWLDEFKNSELFKSIMVKQPLWQAGATSRIYGHKRTKV